MALRFTYFVSMAWMLLMVVMALIEPTVAVILSPPGLIGLLICYLKTGRFLRPPP